MSAVGAAVCPAERRRGGRGDLRGKEKRGRGGAAWRISPEFLLVMEAC